MPTTMPIAESVAVTYTILAAVAASAVSILAASTPGAEDAWSVVGAMLAGGISVVHAMRTQRSTLDLACVLVAAAFCGAVAPGVIINLQFPEIAERMTWHAWSAAGFISGLAGWSFTRGFIAFFEAIKWDRWFKRRTGLDDDERKP